MNKLARYLHSVKVWAMTTVFTAIIAWLFSTLFLLLFAGKPAYGMDLWNTYLLASQEDQALEAARFRVLAEAEAIPQSQANLLPDLQLNGRTQSTDREVTRRSGAQADIDEQFNINDYTVRLTQPILRAEAWYQLWSAKTSVARAYAELQDAEQDLLIRVVEAYLDTLRAQDEVDLAQSQYTAFERQFLSTLR